MNKIFITCTEDYVGAMLVVNCLLNKKNNFNIKKIQNINLK